MYNQKIKLHRSFVSQQGVGLIEVLISLVLLAIGILGFSSLHLNAVKVSSESGIRTDAINLMRDVSENSRYNVVELSSFKTELNKFDTQFNGGTVSSPTASLSSGPSKRCGIGDSNQCTTRELAIIDAYNASKKAFESGFRLQLHTCPGSSGNGTMESECLIASWDATLPVYGTDNDDSDGSIDCAEDVNGVYHKFSDCIVMEML